MRWTSEERWRLARLWGTTPIKWIAVFMHRSIPSIARQAQRDRLVRRIAYWSFADTARLAEMRRSGCSMRQCADALGKSFCAVQGKLRHERLVVERKLWSQPELDLLEQMRIDGHTYAECATALDRSVHSVRMQGFYLNANRGMRRQREWLDVLALDLPHAETAAIMSCSVGMVAHVRRELRRAGFPVRRRSKYA
jgi:DNA-directed RNA polymerase specialized sigma24 family protein